MGARFLFSSHGRRRGICRAAAVLSTVFASVMLLAACGKSGRGAETDPEKGADAEALNLALAQETNLAEAYRRGRPLMHGRLRAVGRQFLAQEREYADALTKAIRGVGGEADAEPEELDFSAVDDQNGVLTLAYELESAALASYLDAAPRLYTAAPRSLAASLAAAHAQHLVVLRQGLGAGLAGSVPEAFDSGEIPPPGAQMPASRG